MYCTALISCGKDTFVPEGPDTVPENAAAVRIVPSYGTAELKSAAPELIAEIAGVCGFKDGNLFNRKFKSIEGTTPLAWLARNYK